MFMSGHHNTEPCTWKALPAFSVLLFPDSKIRLIVSLSVLLGKRSSARIFVAPHTHIDFEIMWSLMPELNNIEVRFMSSNYRHIKTHLKQEKEKQNNIGITTTNLHLSQKLLKQHLLVKTASFITSLHNGQWSSGGRSPTDRVEGKPSISLSKAAL